MNGTRSLGERFGTESKVRNTTNRVIRLFGSRLRSSEWFQGSSSPSRGGYYEMVGEVLMPIGFGLIAVGTYLSLVGATSTNHLFIAAGPLGIALGVVLIWKGRSHYFGQEDPPSD